MANALTYVLKVDGVPGDSTLKGFEGDFRIDEFTFNELSPFLTNNEIGRGSFDPLTVDIAGLSPGLVTLLQDAATGKGISSVELIGLQRVGNGPAAQQKVVSDLTLNGVTVAGYAADGGHDTALAFDFTKLTDTVNTLDTTGKVTPGQTFTSDLTKTGATINPVNHDALAAFANSHASAPAMTYLLKVDGITSNSTLKGFEGDFTVDAYTFNEFTQIANREIGRATFDPLTVDIAGTSPGLVTLLQDAATGKHIANVELIGLQQTGKGTPLQKVSDLKLNGVTVAGYAADGGHDTALAFDFSKLTDTVKGHNLNGTLNNGQTFTSDLTKTGAAINPVNHDALEAFAHSHVSATPALTYLLKVDGIAGDSTIKGFTGDFTVDEATFNELSPFLANNEIGRATFDPLTVDIAGLSPGLVTLLQDAATGKGISSVELIGLQRVGNGPAAQQKVVSDLTLNGVTVAGYAADGGHDTALAFDFTKLTDTVNTLDTTGKVTPGQTFTSDLTKTGATINPVNHDALEAFANSHASAPALTYLLKVDGVPGNSTLKGFTGDFTVDAYTFNEFTQIANNEIGRTTFDPLLVDISNTSPGLVTLLQDAATGKHFASVELIGLQQTGKGTPLQKVSDLTLNGVTVAGYAADGGHDTALAFDFSKLTDTVKGHNLNGTLNNGQTFTSDLTKTGAAINPVNHDALEAFAHSHVSATPALTYVLKVDGVPGDSTLKGFTGDFTVDEATFNELSPFLANNEIGRATFDPLTVDIAGLSPGLVTLLQDAATGKHITSVELIGLQRIGDGPAAQQKVISDLKLDGVTVAGFAADGGHDTALAFDFTKLTDTVNTLDTTGKVFTFDLSQTGATINPVNHGALEAFANSHVSLPAMTYLLKVDGVPGDSTLKGFTGDFTVDAFTFNEFNQLASGSGAGAGKGHATFDPLLVDIGNTSPGLVTLLQDAATGKHFASVELIGLQQTGKGLQQVSDLTLKDISVAGYAADGGHDTALAFDFLSGSETIKGHNLNGTLNNGQTFNFDLNHLGATVNPVNHDVLAAFAHSHDGFLV